MNTPQMRVSKRVVFCAAHHIPGAGKCENNHGHNWIANITVDQINGDLDSRGFIVDVRDLKAAAYKYDHDDLNKFFDIPSTENIAQKIAEDALEICSQSNSNATFIVNVHLVETENNTASASASNFTFGSQQMGMSIEQQKKQAFDKEATWAFGGNVTPTPSKAKFIKRSN